MRSSSAASTRTTSHPHDEAQTDHQDPTAASDGSAAKRPRRVRPSLRRAIPVGLVAASIATFAGACNPNSPSDYDLYRLRMCESGGNYSINLGTGFYGAYQFAGGTWTSLGYGGVASDAPAWVQDEAVRQLWRQLGWSPWPGCSAKLGLR